MVATMRVNVIFKLLQVNKFNELFDSLKYQEVEQQENREEERLTIELHLNAIGIIE